MNYTKIIEIDSDAQQLLYEILEPVILYKHKMLSRDNWREFSEVWLPSLLDQLDNKRFEINHPKKNTIVWFIDQIEHSKNKPYSRATPLAHTHQGSEAILLLKSMIGGYYRPRTRMSSIFIEEDLK